MFYEVLKDQWLNILILTLALFTIIIILQVAESKKEQTKSIVPSNYDTQRQS